MHTITKETFLAAEDPKNRDAMLFDMLKGIDEKSSAGSQCLKKLSQFEKQLFYIKGALTIVVIMFSVVITCMLTH